MGTAAWGKTKRQTDEARRTEKGYSKIDFEVPRPKEEWITFPVPAIVSVELWERVNARLETARASRSGRSDRKYMLSGLLWCKHCGARMVARSGNARAGKGGRKTPYQTYICRDALAYANPDRPRCKARYFSGPALEPLVTEALLKFLSNPSLMEDALERHQAKQKAQLRLVGSDNPTQRLKKLRRELQGVEARERAAAESKIEAKLSGGNTDIFDRLLVELGERRAGVAVQIERLETEISGSIATPPPLPADLPLDTLREVLESAEVSGADKHKVLWQFTQRIYPSGPRKRIGVDIVLRNASGNQASGVLFVLRNDRGEVSVRVEEKDPFPLPPAHRSTYEPAGDVSPRNAPHTTAQRPKARQTPPRASGWRAPKQRRGEP